MMNRPVLDYRRRTTRDSSWPVTGPASVALGLLAWTGAIATPILFQRRSSPLEDVVFVVIILILAPVLAVILGCAAFLEQNSTRWLAAVGIVLGTSYWLGLFWLKLLME
jgi:hypothetical protein